MNLFAIVGGEAITWEDLLVILAVIALLVIIFGRWRRP
jgi:hypothetical protein